MAYRKARAQESDQNPMKDEEVKPKDPHAYDLKFHSKKAATPAPAPTVPQPPAPAPSAPKPSPVPPPGLADRIWAVVRPSGDQHFVTREPDEGILVWAKGLEVTISEYRFVAVVHRPPQKKAPAKKST
jgi:hypothetical protein